MKISSQAILSGMLRVTQESVDYALAKVNGYVIKKVPKRAKGKNRYRTIYISPKPLRYIQDKIKVLFHRMNWPCFIGINGIYKRTSTFNHALTHRDSKWWFQFDLQDAFPSVNIETVRKVIENKILNLIADFEWSVSQYREAINSDKNEAYDIWDDKEEYINRLRYDRDRSIFSYEVLEAHFAKNENGAYPEYIFSGKGELAKELSDLIIILTTCNGILPQGTPTAPFLYYFFLAESGLFSEIVSASHSDKFPPSQSGFQCSVYVDNFVISHRKPIPEKIQKDTYSVLEKYGLSPNPEKVSHQGALYGAPLITGLRIINNDERGKVTLPKKTVRKWRGIIHRAICEPALRKRVKGFIASIAPVYTVRLEETGKFGKFRRIVKLPPQLRNPYHQLLLVAGEGEKGQLKLLF